MSDTVNTSTGRAPISDADVERARVEIEELLREDDSRKAEMYSEQSARLRTALRHNLQEWRAEAFTLLAHAAHRLITGMQPQKREPSEPSVALCLERFDHATAPHKISQGITRPRCELPAGHEGPHGFDHRYTTSAGLSPRSNQDSE